MVYFFKFAKKPLYSKKKCLNTTVKVICKAIQMQTFPASLKESKQTVSPGNSEV